jgi:hypothetical protein
MTAPGLHRLQSMFQLHHPLNQPIAGIPLQQTRSTYKDIGFRDFPACPDLRVLQKKKDELIPFPKIYCVTPGNGNASDWTGIDRHTYSMPEQLI